MRGVTRECVINQLILNVSTHTPHARRDAMLLLLRHVHEVSTHTPHARRDEASEHKESEVIEFQLTRLMRGVTLCT